MILTVADLVAADLVAADPRPELLFFYGSSGRGVGPRVLSQWAATPFEVDGVRYRTAEHYMMASKARLFGDFEAVGEVLASKSPVRAKAIGRSVRGFEPTRWADRRLPVVVSGSLAKFADPVLRAYLASTAPPCWSRPPAGPDLGDRPVGVGPSRPRPVHLAGAEPARVRPDPRPGGLVPVLALVVHGPPLGKGRPRFASTTGHAYTPQSTAEWQGKARGDVAVQLPADWSRLDGEAVGVFLTAIFDRPRRLVCSHTSGRCKCPPQDVRLPYLSTPDGDNVEKITWDAFVEAGVMRADREITFHAARHYYGTVSEASRVEAVIVWGDDLDRLSWPPHALDDW